MAALASPAGGAQEKAEPKKVVTIEGITEYSLPNGTRFLLFPDPTAATVTINMTVLVGSRHEGYGETGMAHLLEHMLFKGSKGFPQADKALIAHGAGQSMNGTTWVDRTNYYESMPASDENLHFGIQFEADRLLNCFIRREDLAKEMTVVRNEFEGGENDPEAILTQRMKAIAFEWHNYGKSTIGNRADIERVPIDKLQAFYRKYYRPDNIILIVAGKFDEAKALGYITKYFGPLKSPETPVEKTYTEEPPQDGERTVTLRRSGKVGVVGAMYHIPSAAHFDNAVVDILARVLGTPPAGRLYKALVETKKATAVRAEGESFFDPCLLDIIAYVADKTKPEEVRDIMLDVVENLAKNPVTKEETDRAVRSHLADRKRALANSKHIGLELSEWAGAGDWRLLFIYRDMIAKVTAKDVNRVAAKYLIKSNRTVGMFIPTDDIARVTVPESPSVTDLVKNYKGGGNLVEGEVFDPTPANIEARVKRLQLKSGIKVAFLPKKTRGEAVHGQLVLRFGNEKSLKDVTTACGFIGPLMTHGTAKHTRQEIDDLLDDCSSALSLSSGTAALSATWQSKRGDLPALLDILAEVLREPSYPEKDFDELRREHRQELEKSLAEPGSLASNSFSRQINPYPKTDIRYVATIQEQIDRLDKTTRADVVRVYKEQLGGQVGELVLVGDFDMEATLKRLEAIFADWKTEVPYRRISHSAATKVAGKKENILTPDKENAYFLGGLTFAETDTDADYPALTMGNYILGGSFSSRLIDKLRQKEGLCYSVGSHLNVDSQDPYAVFLMNATCNPEVIDKVNQGAVDELAKILKSGVTPEELQAAKKAYLQDLIVRRTDAGITSTLRRGLHLGRTFKFEADLEKAIAALTVDDVNRALTAHLQPGRLIIVRAGDFGKKAPEKGK